MHQHHQTLDMILSNVGTPRKFHNLFQGDGGHDVHLGYPSSIMNCNAFVREFICRFIRSLNIRMLWAQNFKTSWWDVLNTDMNECILAMKKHVK